VAWHENLSCDEYDALQADPVNFRSRFDLDNEEAEKAAAARRAQEDADRVYTQSLLAEEQRAAAEERERRERKRREEREERERKEREERERKAREARELVARRKREDEASQNTVSSTTKPCPGCSAPIEKNQGW
jgi:formylmethanofuran dehydrogenase subunit E